MPGARRRQANTYASSSDAAVLDRADFAARYAEVLTGRDRPRGRLAGYSSGPGVLVRILTQSLLGVRRRGERVEIDPVLPPHLDGLRATVPLAGGLLRLRYRVGSGAPASRRCCLGDRAIEGARTANPYRTGRPARSPWPTSPAALGPSGPELEVRTVPDGPRTRRRSTDDARPMTVRPMTFDERTRET